MKKKRSRGRQRNGEGEDRRVREELSGEGRARGVTLWREPRRLLRFNVPIVRVAYGKER